MNEKSENFTDLELVEKVKQGERTAYSILVRRHQKGLMRLSLRFMKDLGSAEDVVQEAFIRAYEKLGSFEARSSFKSWLFQILVNTAKNKLRERKRNMLDIFDLNLGVMAEAENKLIHHSASQIIHQLVEALPHRQRTALILRIYEDLSFKEIAEIMDCPYDTAKANYRHALVKLKTDMEAHNEFQNWNSEVSSFVTEMNRKVAEAET